MTDRAMREAIEVLTDAVALALPYVEEAKPDPMNKPGTVRKLVIKLRKAIELGESLSQPTKG